MTLLEKLQSATEGSRSLSDECLLAWGLSKQHIDTYGGQSVYGWYREVKGEPDFVGYYKDIDPTRNLQDAVDAVPEGYDKLDISIIENGHSFVAYGPGLPVFDNEASTPALALCIAIEKARNA